MRQFVWLLGSLIPIWSMASVVGAEETPGWRPKNGVVTEPTVSEDLTADGAVFDWRDDLYGSSLGGDGVKATTVSLREGEWCSCPTCEHCGKAKPVQATYPIGTEQTDLLDRRSAPILSAVQKRLRLAVQPKTSRR